MTDHIIGECHPIWRVKWPRGACRVILKAPVVTESHRWRIRAPISLPTNTNNNNDNNNNTNTTPSTHSTTTGSTCTNSLEWNDSSDDQDDWWNMAGAFGEPPHLLNRPRCPRFIQSQISHQWETYLNDAQYLRPHRDRVRQLLLLQLINVPHDVIDSIILVYLGIPKVHVIPSFHFSSYFPIILLDDRPRSSL
jgi:hypothetical protein